MTPFAVAFVWAGHGLALGRLGAGLAAASALSAAACLLLSTRIGGPEAITLVIVGVAGVVIVGATSPVIWALGTMIAIGALVVRWLTVSPGRASLSAGRIAGLGAAALLAAAPLASAAGGPDVLPRSAVAAALLAIGILGVLGVPPLGGWASGCLATVRGVEMAPWVILLVPAVLISTGGVEDSLPPATRAIFRTLLLLMGLTGAVFGAVNVVLAPGSRRYGRLLLTDIALAVAALGAGQPSGRQAGLVLVLMHLSIAPLLLHPSRSGLGVPRRLAWLAISGVPLTPGFWARVLVLEACAGSAHLAFAIALLSGGLLLIGSLPSIVGRESLESNVRARILPQIGAWSVAVVALAVGVAPQLAARLVYGGL